MCVKPTNRRGMSRLFTLSQDLPGTLVFLFTYDPRLYQGIWLGFRHGGRSDVLSCHLRQSQPEAVK